MYYLVIYRKCLLDKYPKTGNYLLIAISYALYLKWKPVYGLILLGVTAITYCAARKIEKDNAFGQKKYLLWTSLFLALLPLLIFKYYNFLCNSFVQLFGLFGVEFGLPGLNWIMPLGISFFTFQAIGYLIDVYLNRIKAEHNWWDYMLFVCFFPQIAAGPISKAKDLLPQIKANRIFKYEQAVEGLRWILWGVFLKVVLADRIGASIDSFNGTLQTESGVMNLLVCFLYSFQIYGDFAGYSYMALGVGKLMGFDLINNFQRPYFSQSITEFWHRWHISLSLWLKDYIYIPLGGSRCSRIRNYFNIIVTFLVSGLWHGANWTFVAWGGGHGLLQVFEKMFGLNRNETNGFLKVVRVLATFILVSFLWIFFRQPTFLDAWGQMKRMFVNHDLTIHFSMESMIFMAFALVVMAIKEISDEYNIKWLDMFHSRFVFVRWFSYVFLLLCILLMGVFDNSQFIYINF